MRTLLSYLLIMVSLSSMAQINLSSGLVGDYSFTGNANDNSTLANHGTVVGATLTTDRAGNANSAYSFDGNDYIYFSPTNLKNANYTYSCLLYTTAFPASGSTGSLISIGGAGGDQTMNLTNNDGGTTGLGGGGMNTNSSNDYYYQGFLPTLNTWYHLVLTRDNSSTKVFINGLQVSYVPVSYGTFYSSTSENAVIGARYNMIQFFTGKIDEVKIYNRALSNAEIDALYGTATGVFGSSAELKDFSIYPNPSANDFTIQSDKEGDLVYIVRNNLGEIIREETASANFHQLKMSELPAGLYHLSIKKDNTLLGSRTLALSK